MKLFLRKGNIIDFEGDAIVNCTNRFLIPGNGLDALVHKHGGIRLSDAYSSFKNKHNELEAGDVFMTTGGGLRSKFVLHAIGTAWFDGDNGEELILEKVYENILNIAERSSFRSLAIPNISTGIFRFPKEKAAKIALKVIQGFRFEHIDRLCLYCFEKENYDIYNKMLKNLHI
ncbi:MAG: macro domain-containing protein [bacterium]|nr:macro domain-containing protein [bacterium]